MSPVYLAAHSIALLTCDLSSLIRLIVQNVRPDRLDSYHEGTLRSSRPLLNLQSLLPNTIPTNSQNSTHRNLRNRYNLIEIIPFPLRQIPRIMIHGIKDPTVSLEYLSCGESE